MRYVRRVVVWGLAATSINMVWWVGGTSLTWPVKVLIGLGCLLAYTWISIFPREIDRQPVDIRYVPMSSVWKSMSSAWRRLTGMLNGYELLLAAGVAAIANTAWWVWVGVRLGAANTSAGAWAIFVANIVVGVALLLMLSANGFLRLAAGSTQISLTTKILVFVLWWCPPVVIVLLSKAMRTAARERQIVTARLARDRARLDAQICRTRYPIVLVHGIFFRDWQLLDYWGRIPSHLLRNGATLRYGGHQSSSSVAEAGAELASTIRQIIADTDCGKVNIIAHSKGGLDSRWAISQLGLADCVVSLTTINTPHRGCNFARQLMERIPQQAVAAISDRYNALFSKLGDPNPDFLAGVVDLTDTECARLNDLMPDAEGVYYQSVGSEMVSRFASPFPLNLGYSIIEPLDGANDGLVSTRSMAWGTFLGIVRSGGTHGISHADMIDLLRRDIDDFDICEFYVQLVSGLRERGL